MYNPTSTELLRMTDAFHNYVKKLLFDTFNEVCFIGTYFAIIVYPTFLFGAAHWISILLLVIGAIFGFLALRRRAQFAWLFYWGMIVQSSYYVLDFMAEEKDKESYKELNESRAQFIYQFNKIYDNYKITGKIDEYLLNSLKQHIAIFEKDKSNAKDNGTSVSGNPKDNGTDVNTADYC